MPSTGIVSAEELVRTYARLAMDQGANLVTRGRVISLEPAGGAIRVGVRVGDIPETAGVENAYHRRNDRGALRD